MKLSFEALKISCFQVSSSAVLGPNVTIGANTVVKDGVRIKHSILLEGCQVVILSAG